MMIRHEPLASVMQRAVIVTVVDVQLVSEPKIEGYSRIVDFTALPVEVILGPTTPMSAFSCRYSQGIPHERGAVRVSPLVTGSGLELDLEEGDRAIFLLGSEPGALEPLTLLRAEPLASIELVRQLMDKRGTQRGVERR